jgi:hypothetical protein
MDALPENLFDFLAAGGTPLWFSSSSGWKWPDTRAKLELQHRDYLALHLFDGKIVCVIGDGARPAFLREESIQLKAVHTAPHFLRYVILSSYAGDHQGRPPKAERGRTLHRIETSEGWACHLSRGLGLPQAERSRSTSGGRIAERAGR